MEQFALPLDWPGGAAPRLIVSSSNDGAIAAMQNWVNWPGLTAVLVGPPRSGKTLIARWFEGLSGGEAIDDAEQAGDEALFHAWNRAQAAKRPLLLLSRLAPADWQVSLPDLKSRLASAQLLTLGPPDDILLQELLAMHCEVRGAAITPEAMDYAARRMERGHAAIERTAEALLAARTGRSGPVGLTAARAVLGGRT